MEDRLKLLQLAHRRADSFEQFNDIWRVDFTTMSDLEFKGEIQYIAYLLADFY